MTILGGNSQFSLGWVDSKPVNVQKQVSPKYTDFEMLRSPGKERMPSYDYSNRKENNEISNKRSNPLYGMDSQENQRPQLFDSRKDQEDHESRYKRLVYESLNEYEGRLSMPTSVNCPKYFKSLVIQKPHRSSLLQI